MRPYLHTILLINIKQPREDPATLFGMTTPQQQYVQFIRVSNKCDLFQLHNKYFLTLKKMAEKSENTSK